MLAVRSSSIVIATLLAGRVLAERVSRGRLAGSALVFAGVAAARASSRSRTRPGTAPRAAGRGAPPGARRRSGSRPRSARRARPRGPGSRRRRPGSATRRSRGRRRRRAGASGRKVTRVVSACSSSHPSARRQRPETTSCVVPESVSSIRRASASSARLAELHGAAEDDRVDPEHRPAAAVDRAGLPGGVLERVAARPPRRVGRDGLERDPELGEDRRALRRGRGEDDHARFRATQISSVGQLPRPLRRHVAVVRVVLRRLRRLQLDQILDLEAVARGGCGSARRAEGGTRHRRASRCGAMPNCGRWSALGRTSLVGGAEVRRASSCT